MLFFQLFILLLCLCIQVYLTAVTLGVVPLFLGLTIVASPAIRAQLRKVAERNAQTQSLLVESLNGVQTIKAQMLKIMFDGSGSADIHLL